MLASVLRASSLHGFSSLYKWAKREFETIWPSNVDSIRLNQQTPNNLLESLALAQGCLVPTVLKRVFYELARAPGFGISLNDVAAMTQSHADEDEHAEKRPSLRNLHILIAARENLCREWISVAACVPNHFVCPRTRPSGGFGSDEKRIPCLTEAERNDSWQRIVIASGIISEYSFDPIGGMMVLSKLLERQAGSRDSQAQVLHRARWAAGGWCDGCITTLRDYWVIKRAEVWNKMDVWFGLGNP